MKELSTSIYSFPDLIAGGYLYVDKTAQIYEWVKGYKGQYFLSRLGPQGEIPPNPIFCRCVVYIRSHVCS